MKKFLYGTTALVAAGMISSAATAQTGDPIELSVGGMFEGFVGFASNDDYGQNNVDYNSVAIDEEAELYFDGETTLDNGLTVGVAIQMDVSDTTAAGAGNGLGNQDEAYAYVSGGFGEIQAGTKEAVPDQLAVGPYSQTAASGEGHDRMFVPSPSSIDGNTNGADEFNATSEFHTDSDDATVSYLSPALAGFRMGVSYTPQPGDGQGGSMNTETNNYDKFDLSVSYSGSMAGVDLGADVAYTTASRADGAATNTDNDPETFQSGLSVGYNNFTLAGRYIRRDFGNSGGNFGAFSASPRNDGYSWIVGGSYGMGPYEVGLNYMAAEAEGITTNNSQDELTEWELRGAYTLGPGVTAQASAFTVDYDNEAGAAAATPAGVDPDGDGTGVVGGLVLGF